MLKTKEFWLLTAVLCIRSCSVMCASPIINKKIGDVSIGFCQIAEVLLYVTQYSDGISTNGRDYTLMLLDSQYLPVKASAKYVQYSSSMQKIYIVPQSFLANITRQEVFYTMRIKNSNGDINNDSFKVLMQGIVPAQSYIIAIKARILNPGLYPTDVEKLYSLISRIHFYFLRQLYVSKSLYLLDYSITGDIIEISLQDCSFNQGIFDCNRKNKYMLKSQLCTTALAMSSDCTPQQGLFQQLNPDFQLLSVKLSSKEAYCSDNLPPQTVLLIGSDLFAGIGININAVPGLITYDFFNNSYSEEITSPDDVVDYFVTQRNISLDLFIFLPVTHWAYVYNQRDVRRVYIIITDDAWEYIKNNRPYISIFAFDYEFLSGEAFKIDLGSLDYDTQRPLHYYYVEFKFSSFNTRGVSIWAYHMYYFLNSLIDVLGRSTYGNKVYLRWFYLNSGQLATLKQETSGYLAWGIDIRGTCDFGLIRSTREILFANVITLEMNPSFLKNMSTVLSLTNITDKFNGICQYNPPTKTNVIPTLQFSYCGMNKYQIPEDAFTDLEDGNTRNLKLTLQDENRQNLDTNSWVQFNSSTQTITALASKSIVSKNYKFILVVTDQSNLWIQSDINIVLKEYLINETFYITMRGSFIPSFENVNIAYTIWNNINNWLFNHGYFVDDFRLLNNDKTTVDENFISFTSCSFRAEPCDAIKINSYKNLFFETTNAVRQDFLAYIALVFSSPKISWYVQGACLVKNPPKLIKPWGPLYISTCETFSLSVPVETFYDIEQGNTRFLNLTLTSDIGKKLPEWILFSKENQSLTIVPYQSLKETNLNYLLTATDIDGQSSTQILNITINLSLKSPSQLVNMKFTLKPGLSDFVTIYRVLRNGIQSYFGDKTLTVEYIELSSFPSSVYSIQWTNCTLSRDICETEKYKYVEEGIKAAAFPPSLNLYFNVLNVSVAMNGICLYTNTPPKVINPIPAQSVTYCWYLRYLIPENTFNDSIDGGTRNLKLSMTQLDGSLLGSNSIASFNSTSQEVTILITSSPVKSQSSVFNINAETRRGLSVSTPFVITVNDQPVALKSYIQIVAVSNLFKKLEPNTNVYARFLDAFSAVYQFNPQSIHAYEIINSNGLVTIKLVTCGLQSCSGGAVDQRRLSQQKYNLIGFKPDFTIEQPKFLRDDSCQGQPPVILQPLSQFVAKTCESFTYNISKNAFQDADGSENLIYLVTQVNGVYIVPSTAWVYIEGMSVKGVIPYNILLNQPSGLFNFTVRATNSYSLFTETSLLMSVDRVLPQMYYKYVISCNTLGSIQTSLFYQIQVTNIINNFFNERVVNIFSYSDLVGGGFKLEWSVCSLPQRCTDSGLKDYSSKIYKLGQPTLGVNNSLLILFSNANLQLISIEENVSKKYIGPFNSPLSTINPYKISVNYCGGFKHLIDESLFSDVEDGNTRNLKLRLLVSGIDVSIQYSWIVLTQNQEIIGMPTNTEAKSQYSMQLVAQDSCGLETFVTVVLSFNLSHQQPSYIYRFYYYSKIASDVFSRFIFMDTLANFLGDSDRSNIGFTQFNKDVIFYYNCSISYAPCDLYRFETLYNKLTTNGNPQVALVSAFATNFDITNIGKQSESCKGPYTPIVVNPPPIVFIWLCRFFTYYIPEKTFYDYEQGYTKNLNLTILNSISVSSLIQFSSSSQSISILPTASLMSSSIRYSYDLVATNNAQLRATTSLVLQLQGPFSIFQECQIRLLLIKGTSLHNSLIEAAQFIIGKLATYFGIREDEIVVVDLQDSRDSFYFSWSYCSKSYQLYVNNSDDQNVDYIGLQQKILMKLFYDDRITYNTNFKNIFGSYFSVSTVTTSFTKRCANFPPITLKDEITIIISYGGYYFHSYQNNYFYDFNEGGAFNLKIKLYSFEKIPVQLDSWVNVDIVTRRIIAVVYDDIRNDATKRYQYFLTAIDSSGLTSQISVILLKDNTIYNQVVPFYIKYYFYYGGSSDSVYVNQSLYMVDSIRNYFTSITSTSIILVKYFTKTYGYFEYRVIAWTIAFHTCESSVLSKIKDIYSSQGILNTAITTSLTENPLYKVTLVNYVSTCFPTVNPPRPLKPIPPQTVDFCTVYVFQLPADLFIDSVDGGTRNLPLTLLGSDYKRVSTSSWIQINSATQQLYAIGISSVFNIQSSFRYYIQATNSANLTATSSFGFTINNSPFTSDCKIAVSFKYKYIVEDLAELDLLQLFVERTSTYFGDAKVTRIKILEFKKFDSSYQVVWSNCSFSFSSYLEASRGLTMAYYSQISQIFSKVVLDTGMVNPSYSNYMSEYFEIFNVSGNYDCIEEPPVPNTNEYIVYAEFCRIFYDRIDRNAFSDKRDGNTRNLKLSLVFENGNKIPPDHWVQINEDQYIYGILTPQVIQKATEYKYLVVATDSSGRTANISYKILTSTNEMVFDAYFRTGFKIGQVDSSTSFVLFRFVNNLSQYLNASDKTGQIYVKSFEYPSTIIWTHCSLKKCSPQNTDYIIRRLTTAQFAPVPQFINAMQPYIIPYSTQFYLGKCGPIGENKTIVVPPSPIPVPECGFWTFDVPLNVFKDLSGQDSRSFYLNLLYQNGSAIQKSSWLQFNGPEQKVYALSTVIQMSSSQTFLLTSVHPLTNSFASVEWTFKHNQFEALQKSGSELCFFEFLLSSEYNSDYNDIFIVNLFMTTLSEYLKSEKNTIQIFSFQRYSGYPYNFIIRWINCTYTAEFVRLAYSDTYYTLISSFLAQITTFKNNAYEVSDIIYRYFKENSKFTILSVSISSKCFKPPNTPPKSNGDLTLYSKCGIIRYLVPENAFFDEQDGSTRHLQLFLKKINGAELDISDWLFINSSQYIIGLISNETIFAKDQYEFMLEAVDSQGSKATLKITVFMPKDPLPVPAFAAHLTYTQSTLFPNNILFQVQIVERLEFWATNKNNIKNPHFFLYSSQPNVIKFTSCEKCTNRDLNQLFRNFSDNDFDFGFGNIEYVDELNNVMSPLLEIESIASEIIFNYCSTVAPFSKSLILLNVCYLWSFDLVLNETTSIYNFNVTLTGPSRSPLPSNEFMWLNKYVLEAYPKESFWKSVQNFSYEYILLDKFTGNAMTYDRPLTFQSTVGSVSINSLQYVVTVQTSTVMDQVDNFYISLVMTSVRNQVGPKNGSNIHFLRWEKLAVNRYRVYWLNCSMTNDCTSSDYKTVHALISSMTLPPGYVVNVLLNNCINKPISGSAIQLYIPVCGLFRYKLNATFTKPGNIIKLLQLDGSELPFDSWIRLNATSGEIYALPTEYIIRLKQIQRYILQSANDFVTQYNVSVEVENDRDSYYSVSTGFQSLLIPTTPLLDIEIKLLELITSYSKRQLTDFRVLYIEATPGNSLYYLKYADCTVPRMVCEKEQKSMLENDVKIMTVDGHATDSFSTYVMQYFTLITIQHDISALMVQTSPIVKKVLPTVVLYACQAQCIDISNIFFDSYNQDSLKYTLYFSDDRIVPNSYWTQLANQYICFYPTVNVTEGVYSFKLQAANTCNNSVQIPITVSILSTYKANLGYEWSMDVNISSKSRDVYQNFSDPYNTDISILKAVYEPLLQYLSKSMGALQQIQIIDYKINKNLLTLKIGDCRICNEEVVTSLTNTLFLQPGVLSDEFKKAVQVVSASSDTRCNSKSPKCNTTRIVLKAQICNFFSFKFNDDLCVSNKNDDMRSLLTTVYIANSGTEILPTTSWLQYDKQTRTIFGYPKYNGNTALFKRYSYFLKVTDDGGNESIVEVDIDVYGETPVLDYQLTLTGYIVDPLKSPALQEICLIEKISSYFNSSVNSISLEIKQNQIVDYTWSFCRRMTNSCDCSEIKRSQQLIEKASFSEIIKTCVKRLDTVYTLYGYCKATMGPQLINGISEIFVNPGNFYRVYLPNDQFIDAEDGANSNLTLFLVNTKYESIYPDWLQLYSNSICGVMGYFDFLQVGYSKETSQVYSVAAKDSCGKVAYDLFTIKLTETFPSIRYSFYVWFDFPYNRLIGNCSDLGNLIQLLANTAGVSLSDIVVYKLSGNNVTVNGTFIEFGSRFYSTKSCDDDELITYVEKFYKDEKGNEVFIQNLQNSGYKVVKVEHDQCPATPGIPPLWIILIIIILFFLLLFWLLWFFIPRCCPSCCSRFCSCCDPCCKRGGRFASLPADGKTCFDSCCGGYLQRSRSNSLFSTPINQKPYPSVSPPVSYISKKDSITSDDPNNKSNIPFISDDERDWHHSLVDSYTQTSEQQTPSNIIKDLIKPPLPVSIPYQTESWHDERKASVYSRSYRSSVVEDNQVNLQRHLNHEYRDEHFHSNRPSFSLVKGKENDLIYSDYPDATDATRQYIRPSIALDTDLAYLKSKNRRFHRPSEERSQLVRYDSGSLRRRSTIKRPITVKVRRSELKKYLRSGDSNKIQIQPNDIKRLLRGNGKVKLVGAKDNRYYTNSRKTSVRKVDRSYSTSSLSDDFYFGKSVRELPSSTSNSLEIYDRPRSYSDSSMTDYYTLEQREGATISPRKVSIALPDRTSPRFHERISHANLRKDLSRRTGFEQRNERRLNDQYRKRSDFEMNKRDKSREMTGLRFNKAYDEDSYL